MLNKFLFLLDTSGYFIRSNKYKVLMPGYLLIEALIAITVLGVLSYSLARYSWEVTRMHVQACKRLQAVAIASNYIENLSLDKSVSINKIEHIDDFTVSMQLGVLPEPLIFENGNIAVNDNAHFIPIEVTVQWQSHNHEKQKITLKSGLLKSNMHNVQLDSYG